MNYKYLITIALALCLCFAVAPASAVWDNGNWVSSDTLTGYRVVHDATTGVDSKYRDVNPAIALQNSIDTHQGTVKFIVRAGYSTLSPSVSISNDLSTDPNETVSVDILPDGEVEYQLAAGNYTAILDNFNLPDETAHFVIVPGQESFVPFVGQAASPAPSAYKPTYKITRATYGAPFSFYVTSATYGGSWAAKTFTPGNVDVTSIVNALVKGNGLHIAADYNPNQHYNKLFTDPNYGTVKMLTVNYVANGVAGTMSVSEENDFVLDIPQTNYAEVTDYFKAHLVGNTVSTIATGSTNDWAWLNSFGIADPSVGTVKSITVDYTKDGVVGYYTTNPNVNGAGLTTITLP